MSKLYQYFVANKFDIISIQEMRKLCFTENMKTLTKTLINFKLTERVHFCILDREVILLNSFLLQKKNNKKMLSVIIFYKMHTPFRYEIIYLFAISIK